MPIPVEDCCCLSVAMIPSLILCKGLRSHKISPVHITTVLVLFCFWSWLGMIRLHFFVRYGTLYPVPLFHIGVMSDLSLCRSCACYYSPWEFVCPYSPMFLCIAASLELSETSGYNSLSIRTAIQSRPLQMSVCLMSSYKTLC